LSKVGTGTLKNSYGSATQHTVLVSMRIFIAFYLYAYSDPESQANAYPHPGHKKLDFGMKNIFM
jgi:hypothetical protein